MSILRFAAVWYSLSLSTEFVLLVWFARFFLTDFSLLNCYKTFTCVGYSKPSHHIWSANWLAGQVEVSKLWLSVLSSALELNSCTGVFVLIMVHICQTVRTCELNSAKNSISQGMMRKKTIFLFPLLWIDLFWEPNIRSVITLRKPLTPCNV